MGKTVKTTKIVKKSKTGAQTTINYAKVADRLVEFRADNPRSKIWTEYVRSEDGDYIFNAYIWKDTTELLKMLASGVVGKEEAKFSCDANGTATATAQKVEQEKGFEKLETIAVGRALAILGYAADGNVASDEEMKAFEDFKQEKAAEAIQNAIESLEQAKTIDELKEKFIDLTRDLRMNNEVVAKKDELKNKLMEKKNESTQNPTK